MIDFNANVRLVAGRHRLRPAQGNTDGTHLLRGQGLISSAPRGASRSSGGRKWQVNRFDLVQVHNLLNWQEHLPTLFAMKAGQVRYVGITTSEGRRHATSSS